MNTDLLTNVPATSTTRARACESGVVGAGLSYSESVQNRGIVEAKNGLLALPVPGQKDATYKSALILVARIDSDLTRGVRHYRTKAGELLVTLDQVIRAIIEGNLLEAG